MFRSDIFFLSNDAAIIRSHVITFYGPLRLGADGAANVISSDELFNPLPLLPDFQSLEGDPCLLAFISRRSFAAASLFIFRFFWASQTSKETTEEVARPSPAEPAGTPVLRYPDERLCILMGHIASFLDVRKEGRPPFLLSWVPTLDTLLQVLPLVME